MEEYTPKPKIFACSQSEVLAKKIADAYGTEIGLSKKIIFSDGEFQVSFEESIRGRRIFVLVLLFQIAITLWSC